MDSNDRELLELAAKAAGYEIVHWDDDGEPWIAGGNPPITPNHKPQIPWSPLTDDGDALRLAIQLRMCIDNCAGEERDRTCVSVSTEVGKVDSVFASEYHGNYQLAATRRAVVRAAAEIGRQSDD